MSEKIAIVGTMSEEESARQFNEFFTKPFRDKIAALETALAGMCENETELREISKTVLTELQVEGDSNGVPTIQEVMKLVVDKLTESEASNAAMREALQKSKCECSSLVTEHDGNDSQYKCSRCKALETAAGAELLERLVKVEAELKSANHELATYSDYGKQRKELFDRLEKSERSLHEAIRRLDIAQAQLNAGQPTCAHCRGEIGVILTTVADKANLEQQITAANQRADEAEKEISRLQSVEPCPICKGVGEQCKYCCNGSILCVDSQEAIVTADRDALAAKVKDAEKDKERLDWLEHQHANIYRFTTGAKLHRYSLHTQHCDYFVDTSSVRQAIDAAIAEQKGEAKPIFNEGLCQKCAKDSDTYFAHVNKHQPNTALRCKNCGCIFNFQEGAK